MVAQVCVVGSVNADLTFTVDAFPRPGQTVLASSLSSSPGGKGGNQAVAAARAAPLSNSSRRSVTTRRPSDCGRTCGPTTLDWTV